MKNKINWIGFVFGLGMSLILMSAGCGERVRDEIKDSTTSTTTATSSTTTSTTIPDTGAPAVDLSALSPDPTNDNTPTFTGIATDSVSAIVSVECRVDGGSWQAASATDGNFNSLSESFTYTSPALSDGAHLIECRARDASGNVTGLSDYAQDNFTVDATAPTITSVSPADGATDQVRTGLIISVTFDKDMNESTLNTSTVRVISPLGQIPGTVSYVSGTNTVSFTPTNYLSYGVEYTVEIEGSAADTIGNDLGSTYSWSFTTVEISFLTETIDGPSTVGTGSSLGIDNLGNVHIVYRDDNLGNLEYVTGTYGSWSAPLTIDNSGNVSFHNSLALDSENNAYVSYWNFGSLNLWYATNASGSWATEAADSTANVGWGNSIVLDSTDTAHITYYNQSLKNLVYTYGTAGSWITEILDSDNAGDYTSLAIDQDDNLYVAYYYNDAVVQDIKFGTNASGSWDMENLSLGLGDLTDISLALDSNQKAHISFWRKSSDDLLYTTNASGPWETATIDASTKVGEYNSIAVDENDVIHISYYDSNDGLLRYITNASGSWTAYTVDGGIDTVGSYTSLAIGADGRVHISYYDSSNQDLKYAVSQ